MGLKEFIAKQTEKRKKFKDLKEENDMARAIEQRQKSPRERELEHFREVERQKRIDAELEMFKRREKEQMLHNNIFRQGNTFQGNTLRWI